MGRMVRRFARSDSGEASLEYGLLVALVSVLIIVGTAELGMLVGQGLDRAAAAIAAADGGPGVRRMETRQTVDCPRPSVRSWWPCRPDEEGW